MIASRLLLGGGQPGAPPMWRIGLDGPTTTQVAARVFDALAAALPATGAAVST